MGRVCRERKTAELPYSLLNHTKCSSEQDRTQTSKCLWSAYYVSTVLKHVNQRYYEVGAIGNSVLPMRKLRQETCPNNLPRSHWSPPCGHSGYRQFIRSPPRPLQPERHYLACCQRAILPYWTLISCPCAPSLISKPCMIQHIPEERTFLAFRRNCFFPGFFLSHLGQVWASIFLFLRRVVTNLPWVNIREKQTVNCETLTNIDHNN